MHQLDDALAARLRAAAYTYADVGWTAPAPPPGFHAFRRSVTLTRRDFDGAADDLLRWRVHERAGLRVWASESPLRAGTVVLMRLGPGPLSLRIPCRVVHVVEEARVRGFAYGTLPGHPESGEERFVLDLREDGSLGFTVSAFSRPSARLARAGGPVSRALQHAMTTRYLRALDQQA